MSIHERIGHALGYALWTALILLGGIFGASVLVAIFGAGEDGINASLGFVYGAFGSGFTFHCILQYLRQKI